MCSNRPIVSPFGAAGGPAPSAVSFSTRVARDVSGAGLGSRRGSRRRTPQLPQKLATSRLSALQRGHSFHRVVPH
jgi:hypothetical protein